MPIQAQQKYYYSPEEYLELESVADYKSEYHNGEFFSMAGGTTNHNQIALNLCVAMRSAIKRLFMSDVKLWVPKMQSFLYPDVPKIRYNQFNSMQKKEL